MALKKDRGTETTKAQGHEITKNISALSNQSANKAFSINKGGITDNKTAKITTIGV